MDEVEKMFLGPIRRTLMTWQESEDHGALNFSHFVSAIKRLLSGKGVLFFVFVC